MFKYDKGSLKQYILDEYSDLITVMRDIPHRIRVFCNEDIKNYITLTGANRSDNLCLDIYTDRSDCLIIEVIAYYHDDDTLVIRFNIDEP